MLGYLSGKLISKNLESGQCIVLAHRLGYEVIVPLRTLTMTELHTRVAFWIHTHVREDAFLLYGFETESEKNLFRVLIGVSGLGPKTALSLLNEYRADKLCQLIISKDSDGLSEASGVGKKLAQRLVLELATKLEKMQWIAELSKNARRTDAPLAEPTRHIRDDLTSALLHLGYLPQQIKQVLDRMFADPRSEEKGFENILKDTLKELSGRPITHSEAAHA